MYGSLNWVCLLLLARVIILVLVLFLWHSIANCCKSIVDVHSQLTLFTRINASFPKTLLIERLKKKFLCAWLAIMTDSWINTCSKQLSLKWTSWAFSRKHGVTRTVRSLARTQALTGIFGGSTAKRPAGRLDKERRAQRTKGRRKGKVLGCT